AADGARADVQCETAGGAVAAAGTVRRGGRVTKPFQPHTSNSTLSISAGTGSTRIALTGGGSFRVFNAGTGAAFIQFGNSSVTASLAGGFPLAPGAVEVITPPIS